MTTTIKNDQIDGILNILSMAHHITFIFLLVFARTFSQVFTKYVNKVESLIGVMQIPLYL